MESTTSSHQPPPSDALEAFPQKSMEPADIVVLVLYFLFVLAVGLWVSQEMRREMGQGENIWPKPQSKSLLVGKTRYQEGKK